MAALSADIPAVSPTSAQSGGYVAVATVEEDRDAKNNGFAEYRYRAFLPDGLETEVRERGFSLSADRRRHTAVARALLTLPESRLLDEPISQFRPANKRKATAVLRQNSRPRTLPVVPHRTPTIRVAGRVVALDDGRGSCMGTTRQRPNEALFRSRPVTGHLTQVAGDGSVAAS
ncbi:MULTISPECIES: hypothetical protein [unclassified Streptomyces]|uniref:hypothetical protein n=1 Tax=unclassified Streptomyces TaxID=2593676 RepID=UPI000B59699D|nr:MULTISPECIES: hypothetical protein [unclassified Streptomyces]